MGLSSSRSQLGLKDTKNMLGFGSVIEHGPLLIILILGVNFQTDTDNIVGDGVMKSCFAVRGFV
jgi:hypothetical protein